MEYLFVLLAVFFALVGLVGAVMPVLPGSPVSFVALLLLLLCDNHDVSVTQLVVAGIFAIVISIIDYVAPVWLTKKKGGSKSGTWGATIGLVVGLLLGPIGMVIGPFLGAFIGELIAKTPREKAFNVACMTFIAFMLTTGIKLIYGIIIFVMIGIEAWNIIFK